MDAVLIAPHPCSCCIGGRIKVYRQRREARGAVRHGRTATGARIICWCWGWNLRLLLALRFSGGALRAAATAMLLSLAPNVPAITIAVAVAFILCCGIAVVIFDNVPATDDGSFVHGEVPKHR